MYDPSLTCILYIEYKMLSVFLPPEKIISLNLPGNIISNLDLLNAQQLENLIKAFTQYHKIPPSKIFFIVSDSACFEKKFSKNGTSQEAEIKEFLTKIPFENIIFKKYDTDKLTSVVGMNSEVVNQLKKAFESLHFSVESVVPFSLFSAKFSRFDPACARALLSETAVLKQMNVIKKEMPVAEKTSEATEHAVSTKHETISKKNNRTLLFTIPLFVILLSVLIFIYLQSVRPA